MRKWLICTALLVGCEGAADREASFAASQVARTRYTEDASLPTRTRDVMSVWSARSVTAEISPQVWGGLPQVQLVVRATNGSGAGTVSVDHFGLQYWLDAMDSIRKSPSYARAGERVEHMLPPLAGRGGSGLILSQAIVGSNGVASFSLIFPGGYGTLATTASERQMMFFAAAVADALDSADVMAVTDSTVAYQSLRPRIRIP